MLREQRAPGLSLSSELAPGRQAENFGLKLFILLRGLEILNSYQI